MSFKEGLQHQSVSLRSHRHANHNYSSISAGLSQDRSTHQGLNSLEENYAGDRAGKRLKKVSVFIDGIHLFQAASTLQITVDYQKLLDIVTKDTQLNEARFYSVFYRKNARQAAFFQLLQDIGYEVTRKEIGQNSIVPRTVVGFSADIITDMIAQAAFTDRLILLSGDPRLAQARKYVARQGTSIHLIGLKAITDTQLVEAADRYTDLAQIKGDIQPHSLPHSSIDEDYKLLA